MWSFVLLEVTRADLTNSSLASVTVLRTLSKVYLLWYFLVRPTNSKKRQRLEDVILWNKSFGQDYLSLGKQKIINLTHQEPVDERWRKRQSLTWKSRRKKFFYVIFHIDDVKDFLLAPHSTRVRCPRCKAPKSVAEHRRPWWILCKQCGLPVIPREAIEV